MSETLNTTAEQPIERIPSYDSFGDIDEARLWVSDRLMNTGATIDDVVDFMQTEWFAITWRDNPDEVIRSVYVHTK